MTEKIQAEAFKNGKWQYLTMIGDIIDYGDDEFPDAHTIKILTLADLFKERFNAES